MHRAIKETSLVRRRTELPWNPNSLAGTEREESVEQSTGINRALPILR